MTVKTYCLANGTQFWMVDIWLTLPDGQRTRFRKRSIPTKKDAEMLENKVAVEAFEGRWFDRPKSLTITEAWNAYEPVTRAQNKSWQADVGRAKHLVEHLGSVQSAALTQRDVDRYLSLRVTEFTPKNKPPAQTTLFKELMLLKRFLNYAVKSGDLRTNPFDRLTVQRVDSVRRNTLEESRFQDLLDASVNWFAPALLLGYDAGMRRGEILNLQWSRVDLKARVIRLRKEDTKTDEPRVIPLTDRIVRGLNLLPRSIRGAVFSNPQTDQKRYDFKRAFTNACSKARIEGLWFHDLRRSFVTNARRRGVEESVIMKITGHKTRAIFDRYNVVNDGDIKAAVKTIEAGQKQELAESEAGTTDNTEGNRG